MMGRRKRILVVDDNPVNREIIEEILDGEHEVLMAANGSDALKLAERYRPQVVLLDVMLPGLDGYDICRKLRAMPSTAEARIIMVSAKAMPSERAQGIDAGADDYITKPFDDGDLVEAIRVTGSRAAVRCPSPAARPQSACAVRLAAKA
jgi:two-component system cell cycle response regulator